MPGKTLRDDETARIEISQTASLRWDQITDITASGMMNMGMAAPSRNTSAASPMGLTPLLPCGIDQRDATVVLMSHALAVNDIVKAAMARPNAGAGRFLLGA